MKILNFGSLNLDFVYQVDHFVAPGETLASDSLTIHCGGKGLNQSLALARAGARVYHAGKIGEDGASLTALLSDNHVDTRHIACSAKRTGNAVIMVTPEGQNSIVLYGGANQDIEREQVDAVLADFTANDYLLLQNEINQIDYIMEQAHNAGVSIVFNPSPVSPSLKKLPLQYVDIFLLNEIEGAMLTGCHEPAQMIEKLLADYPNSRIVLTLGEDGVLYADAARRCSHAIFPVKAIDTTAAGDTFTGYFLSGLLQGADITEVLRTASMASAIAVTRPGAAASIPMKDEVTAALQRYHD